MRVLFFDLETTPILGYVWRAYEDNLLDIKQDTELLCFAYKWEGEPTKVVSASNTPQKKLVKKLHSLLDEADVVIGHNGDRFDIRVANALFVKHGLKPPAPYKTVDTLKLARRYFRFTKNNLDYLSSVLLGEKKIQTDKSLWFGCMNRDKEAFKKMEKYAKHDVDLLYRLYHKLKMWHTGHPNSNLYHETTHKCPVCNSNTQKRGFTYTRVGKYQRYQCTKCGAWSKGEKIVQEKVIS